MGNVISIALSIVIPMLAFAFGYGKLSQRVKAAEDKLMESEGKMNTALQSTRGEIRTEILAETRHLDMKFRVLEGQIKTLRSDLSDMKDKLYDEMSQMRQLLYEIKGRLDANRKGED